MFGPEELLHVLHFAPELACFGCAHAMIFPLAHCVVINKLNNYTLINYVKSINSVWGSLENTDWIFSRQV